MDGYSLYPHGDTPRPMRARAYRSRLVFANSSGGLAPQELASPVAGGSAAARTERHRR
jgi:hypothetical protein